jgi:hypothetical protein
LSATNLSELYIGTADVQFTLAPKVINQATFIDNPQYQVSANVAIYSSSERIKSHNVLFDLKKYADDKGGITKFIISGTISFGLLIGFDQDVDLYGESESVCYISPVASLAFISALIVGSTNEEYAINNDYSYSGTMNIHKSVNVVIMSVTFFNAYSVYCVYFNKISSISIINISGNFSNQCDYTS